MFYKLFCKKNIIFMFHYKYIYIIYIYLKIHVYYFVLICHHNEVSHVDLKKIYNLNNSKLYILKNILTKSLFVLTKYEIMHWILKKYIN